MGAEVSGIQSGDELVARYVPLDDDCDVGERLRTHDSPIGESAIGGRRNGLDLLSITRVPLFSDWR